MATNGKGKSIEDVMEDLNKMLSKMGKRDGGGNHGQGNEPKATAFLMFAIIFLGIWGTLTSYYTVDVEEQGVVTRFAAYHTTTNPGLHFKLPFGIDQVTKVPSSRVIREEFGFRSKSTPQGTRTQYSKDSHSSESLMLTGDLNVADVEWILQYKITDPWKYLYHAKNVRKNIRDVSISVMRRVVGDRLVSDVLTTGRVEVADQAKILTQKALDHYDMGISIKSIFLQDVNPPEEVRTAFNEVNAAKQEQEQTINQAERQYNKVIPEAKGKADKLLSEAEAYATELINRAKGDAAKFKNVSSEYKKAPEITRRRMYLETLQEVFNKAKKFTIVDPKVKGLLPVFNYSANEIKKSQ
ncbi:MAG: FtsH protease activity modulator HflK [Bdellovibrionota bacterium]